MRLKAGVQRANTTNTSHTSYTLSSLHLPLSSTSENTYCMQSGVENEEDSRTLGLRVLLEGGARPLRRRAACALLAGGGGGACKHNLMANHISDAARPLTLAIGLSKTGTTSLSEYFKCNGWRVSHGEGCGRFGHHRAFCADSVLNFLQDVWQYPYTRLSRSPRATVERFKATTGNFEVYANYDLPAVCLLPQVFYLKHLVDSLPTACFVLTTRRSPEAWLDSMAGHRMGNARMYDYMLSRCPIWPRNRKAQPRGAVRREAMPAHAPPYDPLSGTWPRCHSVPLDRLVPRS